MRYMEPFEAFRFYQSLKLHFESDTYDAIKYNYKTSASHNSFWKRKDKYFFAKVGKQFNSIEDLIEFYAAHFISGNTWIGEMIQNESTYVKWLKKKESMSYLFEQDLYKLKEISEKFDDLFDCSDGHPKIITAYLRDEISIETVVIINKLVSFMNKADKQITETIVWPDVSRRIRKYAAFVKFDAKKMTNIIFKVFTD